MIRTTRPGAGDKYFIKKASGGFSSCITGSPKDPYCDVLSNCVGYANGGFNETCENGFEKYDLNCNAENFIERAQARGLKIVSEPTLGGIIVYAKGQVGVSSDGAGHVEQVVAILDKDTIETRASNYGGTVFYKAIRTRGNGNWGLNSPYWFRGFIVNPKIGYKPYEPTPSKTYDVVKNIPGYINSNNAANRVNSNSSVAPGNYFVFNEANGMINITRTSGTPGWWINPGDNVIVPEPTPTPTPQPTGLKKGDRVRLIGLGNANSYGTGISTGRQTIGWEREVLNNPSDLTGRSNPVQVGNSTGTTGWFKETALKKI